MPPDLGDVVAANVVILGAPEIVNAKLARCAELGQISTGFASLVTLP
jgi:hypothetical protein